MKIEQLMGYPIFVGMSAYLQRLPYEPLATLVDAYLSKFPVIFQVR
jgi:hypothetical protein